MIREAAKIASNAECGAGDVGALKLRDRRRGVERDRVLNRLGAAPAHIMLEGKRAPRVGADDLKAAIRGAAAR